MRDAQWLPRDAAASSAEKAATQRAGARAVHKDDGDEIAALTAAAPHASASRHAFVTS